MLSIKNTFHGMTQFELQKWVSNYYQSKIQGDCVVNAETKYTICFNAIGRSKTAFGGRREATKMTDIKASAIVHLKELIRGAKYIGTTKPKEKHVKKYGAIGFVIFKAVCQIDGKQCNFKISCMIRKNDYKIHYSINEDYEI